MQEENNINAETNQLLEKLFNVNDLNYILGKEKFKEFLDYVNSSELPFWAVDKSLAGDAEYYFKKCSNMNIYALYYRFLCEVVFTKEGEGLKSAYIKALATIVVILRKIFVMCQKQVFDFLYEIYMINNNFFLSNFFCIKEEKLIRWYKNELKRCDTERKIERLESKQSKNLLLSKHMLMLLGTVNAIFGDALVLNIFEVEVKYAEHDFLPIACSFCKLVEEITDRSKEKARVIYQKLVDRINEIDPQHKKWVNPLNITSKTYTKNYFELQTGKIS